MHIKTNIELNIVHFAVLAVCPIMFVIVGSTLASQILLLTAVSLILSSFVCALFNRYLGRNVKIFITALISALVATLTIFFLGEYPQVGIVPNEKLMYSVLSTIILAIDLFYVDTKALVGNSFVRVILEIFVFAIVLILFSVIREFLAYGKVFNIVLIKSFAGEQFFATATFGFILLAIICVLIEFVYRAITKKMADERIAYEKFVKQVRNEKVFQYDTLRREKLLTSEVEIKYLGGEEAEAVVEKMNTNEKIEADTKEVKEEPEEQKKPKKKNRRLRVSKEAKVEKLFDKQNKGGTAQ